MEQAEFKPAVYTPEKYFALEAQSVERHEYFDGELFVMAGASKRHNSIANNALVLSLADARARGCQVFTSDVRVAVQEGRHYTYPDLVISCDPDDQRDDYLIRRPVMIVEVTSPGTADYDRTGKFRQCQKLSSLRHYLLVSQTQWSVEWYRCNDAGEWVITLLNEAADVLEVPDLGLKVPLADIYDDPDVPFLRVVPPTATAE